MRKIILIIMVMFLFSCQEEKKMEFIHSKAIKSLFLIKNPPSSDSLLKKEISLFLIESHKKMGVGGSYKMFYRYTGNTKDFIKSERPGGYFREYLDYYPQDELAVFLVSKCKTDTTKLVGKLIFYGNDGSEYGLTKIDTLIYHCE